MDEIQKIAAAVKKSVDESYKNGMYAGYLVAERIVQRYRENHKLVSPISPELLLEWSEKDLKDLREKYDFN